MKVNPKIMVISSQIQDKKIFLKLKKLCLKVTVRPEERRIRVLIIGVSMQLNIKMENLGHPPISITGERKKWKYDQKKEKKNQISELINKIIEYFNLNSSNFDLQPENSNSFT